MDAVKYTTISIEREGRRATLLLNRPDKLNAFNWTMVKELRASVTALEAERDIVVVVVRGRGRAFSAGGDLDEFIRLYRDPTSIRGFCSDFFEALTAIEASRQIYVAAINGVCVAGGIELLLACDTALAAQSVRIGDGHLNFGQLPGAGGSQRLPRLIGLRRAKQLMLTAELLDAREAERIGLVNAVYPDVDFDRALDAYVDRMSRKSAAGLAGAKRMLGLGVLNGLKEGLRREIDIFLDYVTGNPDAMEGLLAFKEKRQPHFGGA